MDVNKKLLNETPRTAQEKSDDLVDWLTWAATSEFFNILEYMDDEKVEKLIRHLEWVERGWKERCPFRRDYLTEKNIASVLQNAKTQCPFYRQASTLPSQ